MYHHVFRVLPGELLFTTHAEAGWLWHDLFEALPELTALCLMPNHGHAQLPHDDPDGRLGDALRGYARWRNARIGRNGPLFSPLAPPKPLTDDQKADTVRRYIELNPCRAGISDDPFAWPWSTAREAVGLSPDLTRRMPDPDRYASWLTTDEYVHPAAGRLPAASFGTVSAREVVSGVCGLFRATTVPARGLLRSMVVRTAAWHGVPLPDLAEALSASRTTLYASAAGGPTRGQRIADPLLDACVRVVGDPRFFALPPRDLRVRPTRIQKIRIHTP